MAVLTRCRARVGLAALAAFAAVVVPASAASAHSLESSTISTHVGSDGTVDATISVALETLDQALGTRYATGSDDVSGYADAVNAYLADHLALTDADGVELAETFSGSTVESVEGITSYSVDVAFDTATADNGSLRLSYDAVIEAVPGHEAVVVLTDAAGDVSTAGVITAGSDPVQVVGDTAGAASSGLADMVGYGLHHVLDGADHLLFLLTLLLTAPLLAAGGRWVGSEDRRGTVRGVLAVVTAFTLGHSITLVAASMGWVHLPTRLVEVLVAVSVAVAAVHALRPLVRRGEALIAAAFGLVHGLAFAGILADLGLTGTTSVPALLAFNVGVELAQLTVVLLVFPSVYVLSRTRHYSPVRVGVALTAVAVAGGWVLERVGGPTSPFAGLEAAAMDRPWIVVLGAALLAVVAALADRHATRSRVSGAGRPPPRSDDFVVDPRSEHRPRPSSDRMTR